MLKYDAVIYDNIPLIEVSDSMTLDQLLADPILSFAVVKRLSPTVAAIDPLLVEQIVKQLTKYGHLPKVV